MTPDAADAPALLLLAAGLGTRYGGEKQTDPVGPEGAWLLDYTVADAAGAGFGRVVLVVRPDMREEVAHHMADLLGTRLPFELVVQRTPPDRRKPLGTAHAVLVARDVLPGRFAVANADDLYGVDALDGLARWLCRAPAEGPGSRWALVGYPVETTLSPHGPVNRGLVEADGEGRVRRLREATVELLPCGTSWVGMTHPEDRARVATVLARRGAPDLSGAPDRIPRNPEG